MNVANQDAMDPDHLSSKGGSYMLSYLLSCINMPSFCVIYRGGIIYELLYCLWLISRKKICIKQQGCCGI